MNEIVPADKGDEGDTPLPDPRGRQLSPRPHPTRPRDCRHPHLIGTPTGGGKWVRCGRASCGSECRRKWAWKQSLCLVRSSRELPPRFFASVLPQSGTTNAEFGKRSQKFLQALVRRVSDLEYCRVSEWRNGIRHDHLLLRVARLLGAWVREAKSLAGVRVAVRRVRNVIGACYYIVKHTRRPDRRPEQQPSGYRGRIVSFSRNYLIVPFKQLWKLVCAERVAGKAVCRG